MRILAVLALLLFLAGCTNSPSPDQIRRDTANATANAKADTKALAEGIKEGLHKGDATTADSININAASKDELMHLPGITDARAERIIAARPYHHTDELVSKKVLTQGEYDQISGRVTTK